MIKYLIDVIKSLMPDYEDMILARQEIMEIAEDDDIYESLLSGGYFEEDEDLDVWLWGGES